MTRWFERLGAWLETRGLMRVIPDHLNPDRDYLQRYYLIGGPRHRWFTLCLHKILVSDDDGLHDHPFCYASFILDGSYVEHTPKGSFLRRPGSFRFRSSRSFHRLELKSKCVWSLFFMGPRTRGWGFLTKRGWVPHQIHLDEPVSDLSKTRYWLLIAGKSVNRWLSRKIREAEERFYEEQKGQQTSTPFYPG